MLKNSLKILSTGLLVMTLGSTVFAASVDEDPAITSARIAQVAVLSTLKRTLSLEGVEFSNALFANKNPKTVDTLLREYKGADVERREKILTAVIMGAVERLTGKSSNKIWVTARLASFLLGNRLLPATHGWFCDDVDILTYLRREETSSERSPQSFISKLADRFEAGAIEFAKTYCNFNDFALMQYKYDPLRIFGDVRQRLMPSAVDIFNEAVSSAWEEFDYAPFQPNAEPKRRGSETSDCTGGTYNSLLTNALVSELEVDDFSNKFFAASSTSTLTEMLREYKLADEVKQRLMLKSLVNETIKFLDGKDLNSSSIAIKKESYLVVARLAYFLLANRLLPPVHVWLDKVTEESSSDNVSKLSYLMNPEKGMIPAVLVWATQSTSDLSSLRKDFLDNMQAIAWSFKLGGRSLSDTRVGYKNFAQAQRDTDLSRVFGEQRVMPNSTQLFYFSVQSRILSAHISIVESSHLGTQRDHDLSPVKEQRPGSQDSVSVSSVDLHRLLLDKKEDSVKSNGWCPGMCTIM